LGISTRTLYRKIEKFAITRLDISREH